MHLRITESLIDGSLGFPVALSVGDEVDVEDAVAMAWLKTGRAERLPSIAETAVRPARGEQAVRIRPVR